MLPSLKKITQNSTHRARKAALAQSKNAERIGELRDEIEQLKARLDSLAKKEVKCED